MAATRTQTKPVILLAGDDEFTVKETAARLADQLAPKAAGEFGLETIEGEAANQEEALQVLSRLREALQTVGFFGREKVVWWKSTNLLGDNPVTRAEAVKEGLADLAGQLKSGPPDGVRLLISAIGCDRRKSLFKTLDKVGEVKLYAAPAANKRGEEEIAGFIQGRVREAGKVLSAEAFAAFRDLVAADFREIANELEKLCLYVGDRREIHLVDVRAVCSATRQAVIWELTDALGARQLAGAMTALENLLGAGEQPLRILAMLVAQVRLVLLARDLLERKVLAARAGDGGNFEFVKAFGRLPESAVAHFPRGKDGSLPNAWRFYRCALAAKNFTGPELIHTLDLLLEANRQLVSTSLDARLVLEQALAKTVLEAARGDAHPPARG